MQAVVVDSLMTQYFRRGQHKRIALVLHGWGDSAAGLRTLCQDLAKRYDVIALDLPGFGATAAPAQPWGLDDYVTFVQHFLHKIGVEHLDLLVGHSNGGALAIRGLAQGVLRADRLVLLASAGIRTTGSGRKRFLKILAKTGKVLTMPLPGSVKKRLRSRLYTAAGSDLLVVGHLEETFKRVVSQDVQKDAAAIAIPTLLIYGEADTDTPPAFGRIFQSLIPTSQLVILPGIGHFVHMHKPLDVQKLIADFAP
jgi:pimeloyl-ACP methyl ester carboxylesterase